MWHDGGILNGQEDLPAYAVENALWNATSDAGAAKPFVVLRRKRQWWLHVFNASQVICTITKLAKNVWLVID